ncbi:PEP-CTERM sorting domain-containing protein [Ferribacterium limneticum]|nr:PEP-CTERM sorting domain-containing protein [Ferribacterium limneticum]
MNASYNHLNAFNTWLARTPVPAVPEPETYAMLLAGLAIVGGVARRNQRAIN